MTATASDPAQGRGRQGRRPAQPADAGSGALRRGHARADHRRGRLRACSPRIGRIDGAPAVAFCSDATIQGGAMGDGRLQGDPRRLRARAARAACPVVGLWHSGGARLRRGRRLAARGRRGLRDHDPRLRQGAADLGRARPGRRRRGVRPGADRHRDPRPRGPGLRDRPGRRPLGHRRGRRHAAARRPRAARPALRRRARRRRHRGRTRYAEARRLAALLGDQARASADGRGHATSAALLPESRQARLRRAPARRARCSTRPGARAARQVGAERHHDAGPPRRPHGRRDRQQPAAARRLPRLGVGGEGGAVRADVRRVRRAAGRPRRRARATCPASARSGTASCAAAPSCCTRSPRRSCRG